MKRPVSPGGRQSVILANRRSGRGGGETAGIRDLLCDHCRALGQSLCLIDVAPDGAPSEAWRRTLLETLETDPAAVYVLGGDGTVRHVASALIGHDVPLGVIPMGTANLLARDLGLPLDPIEAARALCGAGTRRIDVARVNGEPFLCSVMLGLPADLAQAREAARGLGAWRLLPHMARKGYWLLRHYPYRRIRIDLDDERVSFSSRAMLVSNNPISAQPGIHPRRPHLDTARLGLYAVAEGPLHELPRLALSLGLGNWPAEARIRTYAATRAVLRTRPHRAMRLLLDGEELRMPTPLSFDVLPAALSVMVPQDGG